MSNSQEQSLDENAVFLPLTESSPEFIHCEKERQAVETLLNEGPEAFYSSIGTERSGCFLSSEEVSQITSWAQDPHVSSLQVQRHENGEAGRLEMEDFCSTYFPSCSDTPPPNLELGWPEKSPWVPKPKASVTVHTSPPAEGDPHVRHIIRWHLQKAHQVIAIVTDKLTDGIIIGDLHNAASRGVPVYIILNQRSIQENVTLNRLRHPNMRVRALGGKTFCSRTGKMVVGEMKDKFLLVDLETVIHGSYSFTWTDAHMHRQLITVLGGPAVDSFDREFRILFAASIPVPDTWRVAGTHVEVPHQLKDRSDLGFQRHHYLETEITNPPSPPTDSLLDWEAMGVVQRNLRFPDSSLDQHEEMMAKEMPLHSKMLFERNTPIMDDFTKTNMGKTIWDNIRVYEKNSPVTKDVPDKPTTAKTTQPSPEDQATPDRMRRLYKNTSPVTKNVPDKPTTFKTTPLSPADLTTPERMRRLYENTSPVPVTNNMPDKSTTFKDTQPLPADQTNVEKMKRLYENISPVTKNMPDQSTTFKNTPPSPADPTNIERMKRLYDNTSPVTKNVPDQSTTFQNTQHSPADPTTPERIKRVEHIINKTISRQLSIDKSSTLNDRSTTRLDDKAAEPTHNNMVILAPSKMKGRSRWEAFVEEETIINETSSKMENMASSRKPIILRLPQSESFSSLSDIMKRLQPQQNAAGQLTRGSKAAVSEMSHSMMDLSVHNKDDDRGVPVPRFKAGGFDPEQVTPALALMRKRNDELKPSLYRTPKNFLPRERSHSYAPEWRWSLAETGREQY